MDIRSRALLAALSFSERFGVRTVELSRGWRVANDAGVLATTAEAEAAAFGEHFA